MHSWLWYCLMPPLKTFIRGGLPTITQEAFQLNSCTARSHTYHLNVSSLNPTACMFTLIICLTTKWARAPLYNNPNKEQGRVSKQPHTFSKTNGPNNQAKASIRIYIIHSVIEQNKITSTKYNSHPVSVWHNKDMNVSFQYFKRSLHINFNSTNTPYVITNWQVITKNPWATAIKQWNAKVTVKKIPSTKARLILVWRCVNKCPESQFALIPALL